MSRFGSDTSADCQRKGRLWQVCNRAVTAPIAHYIRLDLRRCALDLFMSGPTRWDLSPRSDCNSGRIRQRHVPWLDTSIFRTPTDYISYFTGNLSSQSVKDSPFINPINLSMKELPPRRSGMEPSHWKTSIFPLNSDKEFPPHWGRGQTIEHRSSGFPI